ncbi:NADase-type glycan-binding domain-containing protein [Clostridium grantii]|nr:hypothetical protein [Clostridium grantii]
MNYKRNENRRSRTSKRRVNHRNNKKRNKFIFFAIFIIPLLILSLYLLTNYKDIKKSFLTKNTEEFTNLQDDLQRDNINTSESNKKTEDDSKENQIESVDETLENKENEIKVLKLLPEDKEKYTIYKEYFNSCSSFLVQDGTEYDADFINDFRLDTAWNEGKEGNGIDEWIEIKLHWPSDVNGIIIENGYKKTEKLYFENNRPKTLEIELIGQDTFTVQLPDDFENSYYLKLPKTYDAIGVKITILDVYKGSKYSDTCISEIQLVYEQK